MNWQCPTWNPTNTYVWTLKQIQNWYDYYGVFAIKFGTAWTIKKKVLCKDRYEVRFVQYNS